MKRKELRPIVMIALSLVAAFATAEIILRIKNSSMTKYDVEMWRYANLLKKPSEDPDLGHEHLKNASAVLQSVSIRTNEWGMRGGPVSPRRPDTRRILVLGDSITLGWGVHEDDVLTSRLQKMFGASGQNVEVLNGGIGNYNTERYIKWFFSDLKRLEPTDIVVHYFLRGAEKLEPGGGNIILRHSQFALTMWIAANRFLTRFQDQTLLAHYRKIYSPDQPGWIAARAALAKLADYAKERNIRIYLAMMPDIHDLKDYKFRFVHESVKKVAEENGYIYVDLLPAFGTLPPEQVWAMPGDPHPNALGHELMAKALFPTLLNQAAGVRPIHPSPN